MFKNKVLMLGSLLLAMQVTMAQAAEKSANAQTVEVVVNANGFPFSFVDDNNNITGYDGELLKIIDRQLTNYKFHFNAVSRDAMIVGLSTGAYTRNLPVVLDDVLLYNQALPARYPNEATASVTLTHVLQRASQLIPSGAWVAIVSDFHDLDTAGEALLAALRRRCEISAFVTLDDLHLRLPAHGDLAASYQGRDAAFSLSPQLKDDIQHSITSRLARLENRLTRLGIRVNQIVVTQDLIKQLQKGV